MCRAAHAARRRLPYLHVQYYRCFDAYRPIGPTHNGYAFFLRPSQVVEHPLSVIAVMSSTGTAFLSLIYHLYEHWNGGGPGVGPVYAASAIMLLAAAALAWIHAALGTNWSPVITVTDTVSRVVLCARLYRSGVVARTNTPQSVLW